MAFLKSLINRYTEREMEKMHKQAVQTIETQTSFYEKKSLEELFAENDKAESEWHEWNARWAEKEARGKYANNEFKKRGDVQTKINCIRLAIMKKYPDAITREDSLKIKAYRMATPTEENEMKELEKKLDNAYKVIRTSGIRGGQYLDKTHSAVLSGLATSSIAGPLAGGVAYSATTARNREVINNNISKRAENKVWNKMAGNVASIKEELIDLYTDIVHRHDKTVKIHIYKLTF